MVEPTTTTEPANMANFEPRATSDQKVRQNSVRNLKGIGQNGKRQRQGRACRLAVWALAPLALLPLLAAPADASVGLPVWWGWLVGLGDHYYQVAGVITSQVGTQASVGELPDPGPGGIGFTFTYAIIVAPGHPYSVGAATNQSADGTTVVGYLDDGSTQPYHAFRKKNTDDAIDLGTLNPANHDSLASFAEATNTDGSVVVGFSDLGDGDTFTQHAFRWTENDGMVDLGSPYGANGFSRAFGVSGDGNVVIGDGSDIPFGEPRPFRWTADGGFQDLGIVGSAYAVTADGSVVVGQATSSTAFRWSQEDGMQDLGTLPGYTNAVATAVSDDGQVIVGIAAPRPLRRRNLGYDFGTDCRPFVWTATTGMQDLNQILAEAEVDMTGITLFAVTGISPDGQVVCGAARTPDSDPTDPNQTS